MGSSIPASGNKLRAGGAGGRRRKVPLYVWASAAFLLVVVLAAAAAPLVSPYDPIRQSLHDRLKAPTLLPEKGRQWHLLGTDQLGRDILSRTIYGSRVSLVVGFAAVIIGGVLGGVLGLLSGYVGGAVDEVIMLVVDAQLAFPFILLAIGIIAVLGPSFSNLIIVVGLSGWVTYARLVRAQVLTIKEREFVLANRALGGSAWRIVVVHILPNIISSLLVVATLELARTIILESTLSFLGLGIQPPTPSWGGMLSEGREYLDSAWWISAIPGLVLMLTALVVSRVGDWLRDVLDPTLRGA
jgi:peptide/nickel transport system permease protein